MNEFSRDCIANIVQECLKYEKISQDQYQTDLREFGMNSFSFVSLIITLEEIYNIEFPDSVLFISEMNTIDNIYTIIDELIKE